MIISFIRSIILYFALIVVIRLMGKRQIGELEPSEFVVAMLIADLSAVPMQDTAIPLLSGLIPIFTILALELILSALTFRFVSFRKIFCGKPVILMDSGKILYGNLKKTRVSVTELIEHLRKNGILNPTQVKYAILETDGKISVIPHAKHQPAPAMDANIKVSDEKMPISVISDGKVQMDNLILSGKSMVWLNEELKKRNCKLKDVLIMSVVSSGVCYFARKEEHET